MQFLYRRWTILVSACLLGIFPCLAMAASTNGALNLHATDTSYGYVALIIFICAYILVMAEEFTHLRKSKPVMVAAGIIWLIVACVGKKYGLLSNINQAIRHAILEYAELFLFLLVVMTFVNALEERQIFMALRSWLLHKNFSYRQLFCITGVLAFILSPIADNLTTALIMGAVITSVGKDNSRFTSIACINIVIAANAGGAFSPFGDITTLMIWQKGVLGFGEFSHIFIPSLISYIIPAVCLYCVVPKNSPVNSNISHHPLRRGALGISVLFLATIGCTIYLHHSLRIPPAIGMMTGLGVLNFFAFYIKKKEMYALGIQAPQDAPRGLRPFDIFHKLKLVEWDTLLFFYGVLLSVAGLASLGYLGLLSHILYVQWGQHLPVIHQATPANIMMGVISAVIDNIPVMFAALTMNPDLSTGQWLLLTLTTGIGGSLLSIGSAAGIALMGQAKKHYTFFSHLKWTWAIFIGYIVAVISHIYLNHSLFVLV